MATSEVTGSYTTTRDTTPSDASGRGTARARRPEQLIIDHGTQPLQRIAFGRHSTCRCCLGFVASHL